MKHDLRRDIQLGSSPDRPFRRFLRACRAFVERRPLLRMLYRLFVAVSGTAVVLLGLILIPLPGPGWLVVFVGLGVLGTEFAGARRASERLKRWLVNLWEWWQARRGRSSAVGGSRGSQTGATRPGPHNHEESFGGNVTLVSVSASDRV
ncbi:PGPGW domain-containing protein [Lysinibacter cavernae]|uniref:Uncharacterized protein (TIGR02611 family) n=1 Tax=Lysinibacter cavernae TaxID=1640652 RepID=A0A7X5TTK6_9MICO|nr:PGPGW domain-containing protein [Lysinibacter cavernae]NIH54726.1 uncharacterized protein (TIGR02611 family) [Lysinibacter cavernae]